MKTWITRHPRRRRLEMLRRRRQTALQGASAPQCCRGRRAPPSLPIPPLQDDRAAQAACNQDRQLRAHRSQNPRRSPQKPGLGKVEPIDSPATQLFGGSAFRSVCIFSESRVRSECGICQGRAMTLLFEVSLRMTGSPHLTFPLEDAFRTVPSTCFGVIPGPLISSNSAP